MSRLLVVLIYFIISCAAPNTYRPDISQDDLDKEMIFQMEGKFNNSMNMEARLDSIVETIVWKNAPLCSNNIQKRYGFYYLDRSILYKSKLSDIQKKLLLRYHGIDRALPFPIITGIVPGSPADLSGIIDGDVIISVGGKGIQEVKRNGVIIIRKGGIVSRPEEHKLFKGDSNFPILLKLSYAMEKPVHFKIKRGDSTLHVSMKSSDTCNYSASVVENTSVNAWTDGSRIYVASGMMDFASDADLALVIAHEIAHCTEGHITKKKTNMWTGLILGSLAETAMVLATGSSSYGSSLGATGAKAGALMHSQAFEEEADYVGMYLMARAGYTTKGVEDFWRRMAKSNPIGSNSLAGTHPPTAKRYLLLSKTHNEIEIKKRKGLDMIPSRKDGYTIQH